MAIDPCVRDGELVPAQAMRFHGVTRRRISSRQHVDLLRHDAEMIDVDAPRITAQVIDYKAGRNHAALQCPCEAMGKNEVAVIGRVAVASRIGVPEPLDATVLARGGARPEAFGGAPKIKSASEPVASVMHRAKTTAVKRAHTVRGGTGTIGVHRQITPVVVERTAATTARPQHFITEVV